MTIHLSHGICSAPRFGLDECGDQHLIKKMSSSVLIAVADGLGHGAEAAFAAQKAIFTLKESKKESLIDLMHECHTALQQTRGVVLSLVEVHSDYHISWLGVGNVIGLCWHNPENWIDRKEELLLARGGIVGFNLPPLFPSEIKVGPLDTLLLATDGIYEKFTALIPMYHAKPQQIADHIFNTFRNTNDDALILVAQWKPH